MKQIIDFLDRLASNNNREWFNANKAEYLDCKARFDVFTDALIQGIRSFDPSIGALTARDCTYRIYRDTRFSADKSPYKTHMGAFIVPGGKKSGFSGYYFQVGPSDKGYDSGCMLASGNYCFEPRVVRMLREDIAIDEGREFAATIKHAAQTGFDLDWDNALKRVPAGFDADKEYSQWLRLRNFCLFREPGVDYMLAPALLDRVVADFSATAPFLGFINRAVAFEE